MDKETLEEWIERKKEFHKKFRPEFDGGIYVTWEDLIELAEVIKEGRDGM